MKIKQCPDCKGVMDIIVCGGKVNYHCTVCHPDPFGREEDRRMDAQDIAQEIRQGETDDGFSN